MQEFLGKIEFESISLWNFEFQKSIKTLLKTVVRSPY